MPASRNRVRKRAAPLPIPIADQHAMPTAPTVRRRQHPGHLAHKQLVGWGVDPSM